MIVQREEKKDNRGFSLVELIIVIAIMAILVAVLAPQFLKYVVGSRNSADVDNAKEITNAIAAYAADAASENHKITPGTYVINVPADGDTTGTKVTATGGGVDTDITAATSDAGIDLSSVRCKSRTAWTAYSITVEVNNKGEVTFSYAATGETTAGLFASKFSGKKS